MMAKQCWDCGHWNDHRANECENCGRVFNPHKLTKQKNKQLASLAEGVAHLEEKWMRELDELRGREWFWYPFGRFFARIEVHRKARELLNELQELDKQIALVVRADDAQEWIKGRRMDSLYNQAEGYLRRALGILDRMVLEVGGSEEVGEDMAYLFLDEVAIRAVENLVVRGLIGPGEGEQLQSQMLRVFQERLLGGGR